MDDVIGQGREPERDPRPSPPLRWRMAGWALVVLAGGVALTGLRLHQSGSPGTPVSSASAQASYTPAPAAELPLPQTHSVTVVCAPSTGVCSTRLDGHKVVLSAGDGG